MKIYNLPFFIVTLSSILPLIGASLNVNVYHIPFLISVAAICLVIAKKQEFVFRKNILTTRIVPVLFLIIVLQVATGRGFVTLAVGGYVIIFATIFYEFFSNGKLNAPVILVRGISSIYKILLVGMLLELLVISMGFQHNLTSIFSATHSPGYKNYNSADVLRWFGVFKDIGGLNSILLGSQIAGMLSLFSTIWFFSVSRLKWEGIKQSRVKKWMYLSIFLYIVTTNGMNLLLLFIALAVYVWWVSKRKKLHLFLLVAGFVILGFLIENGYLLSRVFNTNIVHLQAADIASAAKVGLLNEMAEMSTRGYYVLQFASPIIEWLKQDWVNKLIGVGKSFFLNEENDIAGDFGFGIGMLSAGMLWAVIFSSAVIIKCTQAIKITGKRWNKGQEWSALAMINAMITFLWLASTIHYNQAFANVGGMVIFALHFAVMLFCSDRYLKLNKSA